MFNKELILKYETILWGVLSISLGFLMPWTSYVFDSPLAAPAILLVGILFIVGLIKPLWIVYFSLATGGFALAALTDYQRSLFVSLGGVHLDGLRLVGIVTALGTVAFFKNYFLKKKSLLIYFVFLLFAGFSLLYSDSKLDGLRFFFKLCFPYFIFVTINNIATKEKIEFVEKSILIGCIIIAFISIILLFLNKGFISRGEIIPIPRFSSVSGGSTHFGAYSGIMALLLYGKYLFQRKKIYFVLFVCFVVFTFLSLQRIEIFGLIIGTILLTFISKRKSQLVLFLLIIIVMLSIFSKHLLYRTFYLSPPEKISLSLQTLDRIHSYGRDYLWKNTFAIFQNNKLLGAGLGMTQYYLEGEVPHNEYLRILADTGILGLTLFLLAYLILFKKVIKILRDKETKNKLFPAVAISGLVFYIIVNIFDNGIDMYGTLSQYVWALSALALVSIRKDEKNVTKTDCS